MGAAENGGSVGACGAVAGSLLVQRGGCSSPLPSSSSQAQFLDSKSFEHQERQGRLLVGRGDRAALALAAQCVGSGKNGGRGRGGQQR